MRVWRLPAQVSAAQIEPAAGDADAATPVRRCLHAVRPDFAWQVQRGDVLVAGPRFGVGAAREDAVALLLEAGIAAVVAPSFGALFMRHACNLGLPLLRCPRALVIDDGEAIAFDARSGCIARGNGELLTCEPLPPLLLEMVEAGGVLALLARHQH